MSFQGRPVVTREREVMTAYWLDGEEPHPPVVRLGKPLGATKPSLYVVGPLGDAIQVLPGDIIVVDSKGVVMDVFKADADAVGANAFEAQYCAPGTQETAGAAALFAAGDEIRRLKGELESVNVMLHDVCSQRDNARGNAAAAERVASSLVSSLRAQLETARTDATAAIAAAGIATKRLAVAKTMLESRGTPMPADESAKVDMYSCSVCSTKTDKAPALSVTHPCCAGIARVCRGCSTVAGALEIAAASNHSAVCDDERNQASGRVDR